MTKWLGRFAKDVYGKTVLQYYRKLSSSKAYSRLREPRHMSALFGVWYALMLFGGLTASFNPSIHLMSDAGRLAATLSNAVLAIGGIVGVVTVLNGAYWAERSAVWLIVAGWAGHLALGARVSYTSEHLFIPGLLAIIGAIGFTLLRTREVYDRTHSPEALDQ